MKKTSLRACFAAFIVLLLFASGCFVSREEREAQRLAAAQSAAEAALDALRPVPSGEGEYAPALDTLLLEGYEAKLASVELGESGGTVRVRLACPDAQSVGEALEEALLAELQARVDAAARSSEIYQGEELRPEVLRQAWESALDRVRGELAAHLVAQELSLSLYEQEEGWVCRLPEALPASLTPDAAALTETVLSHLPYIAKHYTLPETLTVAPLPDESAFGVTGDPAEIDALLATPMAQRLIAGQELAWDSGVTFVEDAQFHYYLDETILVLVWQEPNVPAVYTYSEIFLADGSQLRRKLVDDTFGSQALKAPTELAQECQAVAAVNGDFYAWNYYGMSAYQGELCRYHNSIVDTCHFTRSGDMLFTHAGEIADEAAARAFLAENDVSFSLSFGPVLVENGVNVAPLTYPLGEPWEQYARCCIGQMGPLHYLLGAMNYWTSASEAANRMAAKGVDKAYNVDGGQSSAIVLGGELRSATIFPTQREQSDIVYFATAVPEG